MNIPHLVEGDLTMPADARFGIVVSRFNEFIVDRLLSGCLDTLKRHGVREDNITVVKVPGARELPIAAKRMAIGGRFDALIAIGAVIRGATPHFDYVAGACSQGLEAVAGESGIPVIFGVLTTNTIEEAVERAGSKAGNKGADAAAAAIEMVSLLRKLGA
jgi:6,7-dimethyl-8-ribityllumazine synthase